MTPRCFRGVRNNTHRTEAIAPSAMLTAPDSSSSSSTDEQRIDWPWWKQRLARALEKLNRDVFSPRPVARAFSFNKALAKRCFHQGQSILCSSVEEDEE